MRHIYIKISRPSLKKNKISLDKPISTLSDTALNILLYANPLGGSENEDFTLSDSGLEAGFSNSSSIDQNKSTNI